MSAPLDESLEAKSLRLERPTAAPVDPPSAGSRSSPENRVTWPSLPSAYDGGVQTISMRSETITAANDGARTLRPGQRVRHCVPAPPRRATGREYP